MRQEVDKMNTESGYRYYVLCQEQSETTTALISYGVVFKHNPPTLNDIKSVQDEIVAESKSDQNYHSCIVLNFQPVSLEGTYREDKNNG